MGTASFACAQQCMDLGSCFSRVVFVGMLHLSAVGGGVYSRPHFYKYFHYILGSQIFPRAVLERNAEYDAKFVKAAKGGVQFLYFMVYDGQSPLSYDTKECAVCQMTFAQGDHIVVLRCKHLFHQKCTDDMIKAQNTICPTCRGEF